MRFLVAILFTLLVAATGHVYVKQTHRKMYPGFDEFKARLQEQKRAGTLADRWKNVDVDTLKPEMFRRDVSEEDLAKQDIISIITEFRIQILICVLFASLGTAWIVGMVAPRGRRRPQTAPLAESPAPAATEPATDLPKPGST